MRRSVFVLMLSLLPLGYAIGDDRVAESKVVLGPRNVFLFDGANALQAGDGEQGVKLTLQGLKMAQGQREKKAAHANLCAGFAMLRQPDTALQHCNTVLQMDPNHWHTFNNRAIVYLQLKRYEESEADVQRGQELNPRSEKLKEVKGLLLDEIDPVSEHISIDDRRAPPPPKLEVPQR